MPNLLEFYIEAVNLPIAKEDYKGHEIVIRATADRFKIDIDGIDFSRGDKKTNSKEEALKEAKRIIDEMEEDK